MRGGIAGCATFLVTGYRLHLVLVIQVGEDERGSSRYTAKTSSRQHEEKTGILGSRKNGLLRSQKSDGKIKRR